MPGEGSEGFEGGVVGHVSHFLFVALFRLFCFPVVLCCTVLLCWVNGSGEKRDCRRQELRKSGTGGCGCNCGGDVCVPSFEKKSEEDGKCGSGGCVGYRTASQGARLVYVYAYFRMRHPIPKLVGWFNGCGTVPRFGKGAALKPCYKPSCISVSQCLVPGSIQTKHCRGSVLTVSNPVRDVGSVLEGLRSIPQ